MNIGDPLFVRNIMEAIMNYQIKVGHYVGAALIISGFYMLHRGIKIELTKH